MTRVAMLGMSRTEQVVAALGALGLVSAGVIVAFKRSGTPPAPPESRFFSASAEQAAQPLAIVIDVGGEVQRPGLYSLAEGARTQDAILAAGGLTPNADAGRVNLASPLRDGAKVYVPARTDAQPVTVATEPMVTGTPDRLVSINRATAEELESLPGIGPTIAQRIVEYRQTRGDFRRPEDLLNVAGIGEKKLAVLRPLITL
jgi:competence protein ComEA